METSFFLKKNENSHTHESAAYCVFVDTSNFLKLFKNDLEK